MVHAERDAEITPRADHAPIAAALAGRGTIATIEGAGHYFEPPRGQTDAPHVEAVMDVVTDWLRRH